MGSMTESSFSLLPRSFQAYRAIGWAGLLAGSLDISAALVLAALEGKTPVSSRRLPVDCLAWLPLREG